jgi:serine/threonine protein kinase/Flp pilus assembly protein TadD
VISWADALSRVDGGGARIANGVPERRTVQPERDTGGYDPILRSHPQVSGYRLIVRRGRGGVAEVWEAESPGGHRVALKLVHLSTDLRSGELRALKITRGIRHPGLVVVHGAWQIENLLVISMELADSSLWDRFLEANVQGLRGIPRGELLGYLDPVADAIDYLNGSRHTINGRQGVGIQHRDLKPQNLLLFGDRAKVADFGMARVMEGCVTSHSGPCTVPYAAPEYFGGRTSRQSDQYALAVTYCQLRGGRIPFPGTTAQMAVGHMCNAPDLEGLPEPERPILERALAKRPEERWPDCRSFVDVLKALETAGDGSVPDALPRDRRGLSSERDGAGESSTLGLDPADADFIPVDTGELESPYDGRMSAGFVAGFRRERGGFGSVARIGTGILDRLSCYGHSLQDWLGAGRPTGTEASRRAAGASAVRWLWSDRFGRDLAQVAKQLDRLRQIGSRAARRAAVHSRWVHLGAIAALVVLGLGLWNRVWTSAAQHRPAEPSRIVAVAAPASSDLKGSTPSGSSEAGISQEPTLETPTVAAKPAPEIPEAPGLPETTTKTPVDPPEPEETVPKVLHAAAEPKEPTPETRVVATERHDAPTGTNPTLLGLKSAWTSLQQSGLTRLVSTPTLPASHGKAKGGSAGTAPLGSPDSNAGRKTADGSVALGAITPIIAIPDEVSVAAGSSAKLHIRVLRRDLVRPLQLDFQGLPRGISASGLTIPAGVDSADVVLASSAEAPPGIAKVKLVFTAGSEHGEAATRINVLPPPPATVAYKRGLAALYDGSCDRSIADFTEVIRLDPSSYGARLYRGICYSLVGASREALADYTAAIQLQPDRPEAYSERARVYLDLGEKSLALSDYTEAIQRKPDASVYLVRGGLHHEMGLYDQALADCDCALRLRPGESRAFYLRGVILYHSGDYAGAVADLTEAVRLDPNDAGAYRARRDAYARLGKTAEAVADHRTFERLSRPLGEGASNKRGVSPREGGVGAGRGQSS